MLYKRLYKALHKETYNAIKDVTDIHSEPSLPLRPINAIFIITDEI